LEAEEQKLAELERNQQSLNDEVNNAWEYNTSLQSAIEEIEQLLAADQDLTAS